MIVRALLGVAILTESTQVAGYVGPESTPSMSLNAPAALPGASDGGMRIGPMGRLGGGQQLGRPLPDSANANGPFLVLTGVIAFSDPKQGYVIIGSSVQNTYLARPGQQLPDGSWVREIYPHHVVLEHGGSLQTVGIHGRGDISATLHGPLPSLPSPARWERTELRGAAAGQAGVIPVQPMDSLPVMPRPSDLRAGEPPVSDGLPGNAAGSAVPPNAVPSGPAPASSAPPSAVPSGGESNPAPPSAAPSGPTPSNSVLGNAPLNAVPMTPVIPDVAFPNASVSKQAEPEEPLPAAQDPADEFSDGRRPRGDSRRRPPMSPMDAAVP